MAYNLSNLLSTLTIKNDTNVNDQDDDDQYQEANPLNAKIFLEMLKRCHNDDDDEDGSDDNNYNHGDYNDDDDKDEDDDDGDDDDEDCNDDSLELLSNTKSFKKLQKNSKFYFQSAKIKRNPSNFVSKYFESLKIKVDQGTRVVIWNAKKQGGGSGNSTKKLNKLKNRQSEMTAEITKKEKECLAKLKANENEAKRRANKIWQLLENAPKKEFGMDMMVEQLADVRKDYRRLECQLFAGNTITYDLSTSNDAEKKLGTINSSCCYDYKLVSPVIEIPTADILSLFNGYKVPVEETHAELIFYFESVMKIRLANIYNSSRLMYILTKFSTTKDVIELVKIFNILDVPKPTKYNLNEIRNRFEIMNEIQKIPSDDYVKAKCSRNKRIKARSVIVEFCMGLILGKFDLQTKEVRELIFKDIGLILFSWRIVGVRMRRHVLGIAKIFCLWLSEEKIRELKVKIEDAEVEDDCDHDYDTDEECERLMAEQSSESDNSNFESEHEPADDESDD
jgi:hypothetical protein